MKETFYLKHDYNSRNDEKVLKLRSKLGAEGFGIYWMLLEKLAESSEGRLLISDIECIAFELHTECERIADVIRTYGLFKMDEDYFWSGRLMSDLKERNEKSEKAKLSAKIRWNNKVSYNKSYYSASRAEKNANAMQGEERRGKESIKTSKDVKSDDFLPELLKTEPEEVIKQDTTTLPPVAAAPSLFDQFWELYPKHVSKKDACKAWGKMTLSEQQEAIKAIHQHVKQPNWLKDDGVFIPHPSTWLNKKRWEDEIIGVHKPIDQEKKKKNEEEFQKIFSLTRAERVALLKQKQHESINGQTN